MNFNVNTWYARFLICNPTERVIWSQRCPDPHIENHCSSETWSKLIWAQRLESNIHKMCRCPMHMYYGFKLRVLSVIPKCVYMWVSDFCTFSLAIILLLWCLIQIWCDSFIFPIFCFLIFYYYLLKFCLFTKKRQKGNRFRLDRRYGGTWRSTIKGKKHNQYILYVGKYIFNKKKT